MAEKWLSIVEYARAYNVSDMTVRRRIKTGRLNAVLQDGKYFIPMKDDPRSATPTPPVHRQPEPPSMMKAHPAPQQTFQPPTSGLRPSNHVMNPSHQHQRHATNFEGPRARPIGPFNTQESVYNHQGLGDTEAVESSLIPASLKHGITGGALATVDAAALLAFCEASMKKHQESERRQVERFKSKLETLEATVGARDNEIKSLHQQLEDLQLLVKVLEPKRT